MLLKRKGRVEQQCSWDKNVIHSRQRGISWDNKYLLAWSDKDDTRFKKPRYYQSVNMPTSLPTVTAYQCLAEASGCTPEVPTIVTTAPSVTVPATGA